MRDCYLRVVVIMKGYMLTFIMSLDWFNFFLLPDIWKWIGIPCLMEIKRSHSWRESGVPERQFLVTALGWLTDSVCSYSGMWNESSFQLLYLVFGFCFQCGSICLALFFQNFDFWVALLTLSCESWACFAHGGAWLQEENADLYSTWSTL